MTAGAAASSRSNARSRQLREARRKNEQINRSSREMYGSLKRQPSLAVQGGDELSESMPTLHPGRQTARRGGGLSESMPILHSGQQYIKASSVDLDLSESAKGSEPSHSQSDHELYLITGHQEDATLRKSSMRQNEEGGPRQAQQQQREDPRTVDHRNASKQTSLTAIDNFNEETVIESTTSPMEKKLKAANDLRNLIGKVVNDYRVQNVLLLLIMINAIMMGIATFPIVKKNPHIQSIFERTDKIFLILFTIESSMQLIYHGWKLFKDGFLVFDVGIVILCWALQSTSGSQAQVFRGFRVFRAMRLITRIATLKNLISALFSVFPKMTAIAMFLCLIFYIFAVMFTQLFKGMYDQGQVDFPYFESIFFSLFTLFQMMTLDEWYDILADVQKTHSWAWVFFLMFIIVTAFVVVNLIIAVICDAVHVMGNDSKAGLVGFESEELRSIGMESDLYDGGVNKMTNPASTEQRLQDLQRQLEEMVLVQDQMKTTIEVLMQQLSQNAVRKVGPLSIDSKGQALLSKGGEGSQSNESVGDYSDST